MTIFFTDLDNTAIYSHHHAAEGPIVWVETLNGKPQSFMTRRYYDYFAGINTLRVVPVTTRTPEQYKRLEGVALKMKWSDVLTCNGAILLKDSIEDDDWRDESLCMAQEDQPSLAGVYDELVLTCPDDQIVSVPGVMFYIKAQSPDTAFEYVRKIADPGHVKVYRDSGKVYCIAAALSKGNAIKRYMKRHGSGFFIAAGDSEFDISMLEQTDICLCPGQIADRVNAAGKKIVCKGIFSDEICNELEKMRNERLLR